MDIIGLAALAAMVLGLAAVIAEIALKSPRSFAEIASDVRAFALAGTQSPRQPGTPARSRTPANEQRLAA